MVADGLDHFDASRHLRALWANLLSAALDPSAGAVDRKFVSTLNDLSKEDAIALTEIHREWSHSHDRGWSDGPFEADGVEYEGGGIGADPNSISIITLNRLGLIRPTYVRMRAYTPPSNRTWSDDTGKLGEPIAVPSDLSAVKLTRYGQAFCLAVMPQHDSMTNVD